MTLSRWSRHEIVSVTYIYIYKNQFLALLQVYPSWAQQIDIPYQFVYSSVAPVSCTSSGILLIVFYACIETYT